MRNKFLYTLCCLILAAGCTRMPDELVLYEIGCRDARISLDYLAGAATVDVLSNGDYTASLPAGTDWIRFASGLQTTGTGDGPLTLSYDTNRSIPRSIELTLSLGNNSARVLICQEGLLDGGISLSEKSLSVTPDGGELRVKVNTLRKADDIRLSLSDDDSPVQWIYSLRMEDNFLKFTVLPAGVETRHARIHLAIKDTDEQASLLVCQLPAGTLAEKLEIAELKAILAANPDWKADKHFLLSGQVLNDYGEGNGAENRNISADTPDREWKYRTVYLQDRNRTAGIKFLFDERCDALFSPGDVVCLDLFGLDLKNLPLSAVVSAKDSIAPAPRIKTIASLSEDDLHTLITIPNVEIPYRKGPYMPMDIRDIGLVTAVPVPLCDGDGRQIPMMINADCTFSRDGEALPQGYGSVTGVLVRENCDNFEWDTALEDEQDGKGISADYRSACSWTKNGRARLQIRPMKKSDIALSNERDMHTGENGLSRLLYEWAWCDSIGVHLCKTYDRDADRLYPSWPLSSRPDTLSAGFCCIGANGNPMAFKLVNDFTHLGPYLYGGEITRPENGNGIRDVYGRSAHWNPAASVNTTGVIISNNDWSNSNGSAWQVGNWSTSQYWRIDFPTRGITRPVSICFGTMGCFKSNRAAVPGAPREWTVEWSINGSNWTKAADYDVPDFPPISGRRVWQLPGTKFVALTLPDAVLDKDRVYIRLRPRSSAAGTASAYVSPGALKNDADHWNAINYVSIRCKQ